MKLPDYLRELNRRARCNRPTLQNSYDLACRALEENLAGDFVECGVFCGAQLAAMYRACSDARKFRRLHFFDSFKGIPQATHRDGPQWVGRGGDGTGQLVSTGYSTCKLEDCKTYLKGWGVDLRWCVFHEGWFQATLPATPDFPVSVLRLDADLYESTRVCLERMFPRVVQGGFVIVDDYALQGCRAACDEYFSAIGFEPSVTKIKGGGGPVWFVKGAV